MRTLATEFTFTRARPYLTSALKTGLVGGIVTLLVCLIGIIQASMIRRVISPWLFLGQVILLLLYLMFGSTAVRRGKAAAGGEPSPLWTVVTGALTGLIVSIFLTALVLIGQRVNLRPVLIQASPELYGLLTFHLKLLPGTLVLLGAGLLLGGLAGGTSLLPSRIRNALVLGFGLIPVIAIILSAFFAGRKFSTLTLPYAAIIFVVGAGLSYLWSVAQGVVKDRFQALPKAQQRAARFGMLVGGLALVLVLPLTGEYPSQVFDMVLLYVLMGLGLNIVVGFAGLLDLGYVAFFALGAYTMAVLTSPEIHWAGLHLSFWGALPFCVLVGVLAGVLLGVPVLGMRGDYLAIVTLGFGEIIRIVALSDWLKPFIGGSNGITLIPTAAIGTLNFKSKASMYYLILAGCVVAAFVANRVKDSRLGRAWMALREDEDVAQAMGIDLVRTKLLAFATGAALSGLAGGFFGTLITSVYPHSFTLMISINVLCVIIVGGMGSNPGVVLGAIALAGLPELLREFSEYRLWVFGAALVVMMLTRPEGLMPEARRKLEMHEADVPVLDESGTKHVTVLG